MIVSKLGRVNLVSILGILSAVFCAFAHAGPTAGMVAGMGYELVDRPQPQAGAFATPLTNAMIDTSAMAEWVDGAERPLANPLALRQAIWTQTDAPASGLLRFGDSKQPGVRSMRLGFTAPVIVGSVLVNGGGQLSVLKLGAAYPGNLADNSQWIPAQRVVKGEISSAEVDAGSFAVWVLPPGTRTRALRFTHTAALTDSNFSGVLGGVYLLAGRFANLAPQASVTASANATSAPLLTNEKYDGWAVWDNGPEFRRPVTDATPEWVMLSWPRPVVLNGIAMLWAGFNSASVQVFSGPETESPSNAPDGDWRGIGPPSAMRNQYPRPLGVDWIDFGKPIETRAVRLRITSVTDESHHPHLKGSTRNGTRVWLGEVMALSPLQMSQLQTAAQPAPADATPKPPIAVKFQLQSAGYVSLVIDDASGNRVRNLVSNTWFAAGLNTVWWDGTDDLGRNLDAANHGVYLIPTHFVSPGTYRVSGITHQAIDLHYEFSVYNAGHPAWPTADGTGSWLADHTPPSSTLFVPADKAPGGKPLVYLGSYVNEGGSGLAWVDLNGAKQGGRGWIGCNWTSAPYLARDAGSRADADAYAYAGAVWYEMGGADKKQAMGVVRLTALTNHGDKSILNYRYDFQGKVENDPQGRPLIAPQMGGLAVHDGLAVVSLSRLGELLFVDAASGKALGLAQLDDPRGLAFDGEGRLLVLSGKRLLRYTLPRDKALLRPDKLSQPESLVSEGFDDPTGITLDNSGNIYVSDRGNSHQVKIFSAAGKFLRSIGNPGAPKAGPYDPLHMNNPRGLTIDSNGHLWVAEEDFQPKRVSEWTLDGKLVHAFYGPAEYGGGGALDPSDKTRFYYHGMEFKLDWKMGTDAVSSILYRPAADALAMSSHMQPTTVLYGNGHRYFTNAYMGSETQGVGVAVLYLDTGGVMRPAAAFGRANDWDVLKADAFRALWPQGIDPSSRTPENSVLFSWSDRNNDGQVEPDELILRKAASGSINIMPDLTIVDAYVDGKAMRYAPTGVTSAGIPVYDPRQGAVIADGAQIALSDGGGQALYSTQATVETTAPRPFSQAGVGGVDAQGHRWSYPSLWPGLHPSHSAPVPDRDGELIGTTHLLGGFVNPVGSDAGPVWGIDGNFGDMYLFTADGMFVSQLFQDMRTGKPWNVPIAQRNMPVNDLSLSGENFFPSMTQTSDGQIYLDDGVNTSIVRVDGLSTLRRIPASTLEVTRDMLTKAQAFLVTKEASRQQELGARNLVVTIRSGPPPALKDLIAGLQSADWATIDHRITQVGWNGKPDDAQAAITIAAGRLYAAFRTTEPNLIRNSGAVANAPFKSGGALDLMLGTNPQANPKRDVPQAGDVRLLVYQVNGKTKAMLYRAVVPGTTNPVPFSSPSRTITLDQVMDVSDRIELFAAGGSDQGQFVFSVPLDLLGLKPTAGERIKADIGILRGDGVQTVQRVYWSNKATGITSDVPSEAELTPALWGEWSFQAAP